MYELSKEQRLKFTIVLMEYLNAGDWKGLFAQTDCEEFAQQHTQFYEDVSWENETLEKDCTEAVEFILIKDSGNLKAIWALPGVQIILSRKDPDLHKEIEALIEQADIAELTEVVEDEEPAKVTDEDANPDILHTNFDDTNTSLDDTSTNLDGINTSSVFFDTNQSPYKALEEAEALLKTQGAPIAYDLMHEALQGFLRQICNSKSISFGPNDEMTFLLAKVIHYIKAQADTGRNEIVVNDKTLSMLRAASSMVATINDLRNHHSRSHSNEDSLTEADARFAINLVHSVMSYIDGSLFK